jgi:predicted phosphate transport protein (TIGR00153 family)
MRGNFAPLAFSLVPKDRVFFDLFAQAGGNSLRAAKLLQEMLNGWPETAPLAREILLVEQEGDRITHDLSQRTNSTFVTPIDAEDIYNLAGKIDDIVDHVEEAADFMGLYGIEAPMDKAQEMADVLVKACEQLAVLLENMRGYKDLDQYWIEIHRIENDGDRLYREALASLFRGGIDPMAVIRWRDIILRLERAIDATEEAATVVETIATKYA